MALVEIGSAKQSGTLINTWGNLPIGHDFLLRTDLSSTRVSPIELSILDDMRGFAQNTASGKGIESQIILNTLNLQELNKQTYRLNHLTDKGGDTQWIKLASKTGEDIIFERMIHITDHDRKELKEYPSRVEIISRWMSEKKYNESKANKTGIGQFDQDGSISMALSNPKKTGDEIIYTRYSYEYSGRGDKSIRLIITINPNNHIVEVENLEDISSAKKSTNGKVRIIGFEERGGIQYYDGKPVARKHNIHRYKSNPDQPWGHDEGGFTENDLVPVRMHMSLLPPEKTREVVGQWLVQLKKGNVPEGMTQGVEVEGTIYRAGTTVLSSAYRFPAHNSHPELMDTTLETATGPMDDGKYPSDPIAIAQQIGCAILEAHHQANQENNIVVHSSVPEGGILTHNTNTQVPYLQAFAPRVLKATTEHADQIPRVVIDLYQKIGANNIVEYLTDSQVLNWPVNALHVHNGVPMIGEFADTRSAFATAQIRTTEMAKILSFMMYNSQYCYGVDTGHKDVRAIMRRLLWTAHGGIMPQSADDHIQGAVKALESGEIHSLPRYPTHSQHDRFRIRMDGITLESIDAPMNPDLRLDLGWAYINQIMNVIALDALEKTGGDESQVLTSLQSQWGELMSHIAATDDLQSSLAHDLIFDDNGYDSKAPWLNKSYRQYISDIMRIFEKYAQEYSAIKPYVNIVNHLLGKVTQPRIATSLEEYFGTEAGIYTPNGKNMGIVTEAKIGHSLDELLHIQSESTRLQAEALTRIKTDNDLMAWFGIN